MGILASTAISAQEFKSLLNNSKFADIPLGNKRPIAWYIEELEMKNKPMMDHAGGGIELTGQFSFLLGKFR